MHEFESQTVSSRGSIGPRKEETVTATKKLVCPNGCQLDDPNNSGWTLWDAIAVARHITIMADGEIVAYDPVWGSWHELLQDGGPEFCCGLCKGRVPESEIGDVTYLDRVEPAKKTVNGETTWKNAFLTFEYSSAIVPVVVPEDVDEDEYDYETITREASRTLADDLGIPSILVERSVQGVEIEWR